MTELEQLILKTQEQALAEIQEIQDEGFESAKANSSDERIADRTDVTDGLSP